MGKSVVLTEEQEKIKSEIKRIYDELCAYRDGIKERSSEIDTVSMYKEMASLANKLHIVLRESGSEPKHHRYMLKNRGVPVDDVRFYDNLYAVEDLLAFIDDEDANNDPEDSTIGQRFGMNIYSRRWGYYDKYYLTRTENGWLFDGIVAVEGGECDKSGEPYLYEALDHDLICYPKQIGEFLDYTWRQAAEGLEMSDVQEAIDDIAEWINVCEQNTPGGVFRGLM